MAGMRRARATFLTGCGLVLTISACGDGSSFAQQPVGDILEAARAAGDDATATHVVGELTDQGKHYTVDLHLSADGDCWGDLKTRKGRIELRVAEKRVFFRADQAFFEQSGLSPARAAETVAQVGDRWLETKDTSGFGPLCDLSELLHGLTSGASTPEFADLSDLAAQGTSQVAGVDVVEVSGKEEDGTYRMYVAVDEPHYVMRLVADTDTEEPGTITFSDYDLPVGTTVPDKHDIVPIPAGG